MEIHNRKYYNLNTMLMGKYRVWWTLSKVPPEVTRSKQSSVSSRRSLYKEKERLKYDNANELWEHFEKLCWGNEATIKTKKESVENTTQA
ncbi:hypothetical protein Tco_0573802 [Tanacetum coccineum]